MTDQIQPVTDAACVDDDYILKKMGLNEKQRERLKRAGAILADKQQEARDRGLSGDDVNDWVTKECPELASEILELMPERMRESLYALVAWVAGETTTH